MTTCMCFRAVWCSQINAILSLIVNFLYAVYYGYKTLYNFRPIVQAPKMNEHSHSALVGVFDNLHYIESLRHIL